MHNAALFLPTARSLDAALVFPQREVRLCAVVHKLSLWTVDQKTLREACMRKNMYIYTSKRPSRILKRHYCRILKDTPQRTETPRSSSDYMFELFVIHQSVFINFYSFLINNYKIDSNNKIALS